MKIRFPSVLEIISRKKIIKIPIDPKDRYALASFSGRSRAKILDPSKGGIGNKLKIASRRFKCVMAASKS